MLARLTMPLLAKIAGALQIVSLGVIAFLLIAKAGETRRADKWQASAREEAAAHALTKVNIEAGTAKAKADDAANALRVERDQNKVSEEVSSDLQAQLADLRRRYDALRLRAGTASTNSSGGGSEAVPSLPNAPGGNDGSTCQAGLPSEDALTASEQALRLKALQDWVRGQGRVER